MMGVSRSDAPITNPTSDVMVTSRVMPGLVHSTRAFHRVSALMRREALAGAFWAASGPAESVVVAAVSTLQTSYNSRFSIMGGWVAVSGAPLNAASRDSRSFGMMR